MDILKLGSRLMTLVAVLFALATFYFANGFSFHITF